VPALATAPVTTPAPQTATVLGAVAVESLPQKRPTVSLRTDLFRSKALVNAWVLEESNGRHATERLVAQKLRRPLDNNFLDGKHLADTIQAQQALPTVTAIVTATVTTTVTIVAPAATIAPAPLQQQHQ